MTFKLAANNPLKAVLLNKLAEIGNVDNEKVLGQIETFLHGAVPVGKRKDGYQSIFTTSGVNPLSTVGQEAQAAPAFLPGGTPANSKALLGFISPFITGGTADLTSGKNSKHGIPGDVLAGVASALPQYKLYQALHDKPYQGPSRYKHTKKAAIESFFGWSQHDLNVAYENYKAAQAKAGK